MQQAGFITGVRQNCVTFDIAPVVCCEDSDTAWEKKKERKQGWRRGGVVMREKSLGFYHDKWGLALNRH